MQKNEGLAEGSFDGERFFLCFFTQKFHQEKAPLALAGF